MIFPEKPLVFVSYSRKDKEAADDLGRRLTKRGVRLWVDRQDIVGGEWRQNIKKALRHSSFFLACLSKNTAERGEVLQYEFDSALEIQRERLEGEIYLIPVRLEPCDIPESLKHIQCLDLYEPQGLDSLLRALRTKGRPVPALAAMLGLLVILGLAAGYIWLRPTPQSEFLKSRSEGKSAPVSGPIRLGITLWKMERSKDSDPPSTREIVHPQPAGAPVGAPQPEPISFTPVRLPAGGEFRLGDPFQAGIECSRTGYLYIINRTLRTDGSTGPASLIFPTNRIRGGDNHVWPGRLIRLPDRDSVPPYWEFKSSTPKYAGELLIALLVPQPLDGFTSQDDSVPVDDATLAEWMKRYGVNVHSTTYQAQPLRLTADEAAARDRGAQLPTSAPLPQAMFQADRDSNGGIAAAFPIKVRAKP